MGRSGGVGTGMEAVDEEEEEEAVAGCLSWREEHRNCRRSLSGW